MDVYPYQCPDWAKCLSPTPTHRLKLANERTPIHRWELSGIPAGFELSIKRDDMTGCLLSGNKVRKLDFLLAEALKQKCRHVITCGDVHSNHCRATVVAARRLGLTPHLILRDDVHKTSVRGCSGNEFFTRLCGPNIYRVPLGSPYSSVSKPMMEKVAKEIKKESGDDSYIIPVAGGSSFPGVFGLISTFEEMISQGLLDNYDDLVFPCSSGCTAAGMGISNYLTGSNIRCHAINVTEIPKSNFLQHINQTIVDMGLPDRVKADNIVDIIEGHQGKGYNISTQEELDFLSSVAVTTGIMLDPTYSGKAALGMVRELNNNQHRFKGNRILFLHTGGVFGMYNVQLDTKTTAETRDEVKLCKYLIPYN
ncbi:uncharacterized protein [Argopecten irradians]|uniref:uncharacterized protein n=1 Tax=Argopecten irradians TaxID=31199 RepID=UPI00371D0A25